MKTLWLVLAAAILGGCNRNIVSPPTFTGETTDTRREDGGRVEWTITNNNGLPGKENKR